LPPSPNAHTDTKSAQSRFSGLPNQASLVLFNHALKAALGDHSAEDVTGKKTNELELLHSAVEQARDAIVITDARTEQPGPRILYTNQAFCALTGFSQRSLIGTPLFALTGWKASGLRRRFRNKRVSPTVQQGELLGHRPDGTEYIAEVQVNPILTDSSCEHFVAILRDITEKKRVEQRLMHMAHHDMLTGLPNRKLFHDRLQQSLKRAERYQERVALLFIDLDGFKPINDSLGHGIGDLVLRAVAERLMALVRASDTVARLGGDEFTIILPGLNNRADAKRVAEKCVECVSDVIVAEGQEVFISPSIGIALYPDNASNAQELVRHADAAMYQAKHIGPGEYSFYSSETSAEDQEHSIIREALGQALEQDEFALHYRSIVHGASRTLRGVEPMLRWKHPIHGMISPARFLPNLAALPIEEDVGFWVLQQACHQLQRWQQQAGSPLQLYVPLFKKQILLPDIVERVSSILDTVSIDPARLNLQLPEAVVLGLESTALRNLETLQERGIQIVVTSFGTSHLSLPQLRALPIDCLKIDPSFVRSLGSDSALVRGIAVLSHSLGLTVIADGVSSPAHQRALTELGCDLAQGKLYGSPLAVPSFEKHLGLVAPGEAHTI